MSTIKSSAEDLTLNADGSGNDIKFQSDGSEVAAIDQAGNLTVSGTVDGVDIQTLNTTASAALPKAGGTMTGTLVLPAGNGSTGGLNMPNSNSWITASNHGVMQADATMTYFYGGTGGVQFRPVDNASRLVGIDDTGSVTIDSGNLVIGTAGKGIDFSATADGGVSTPNELLDDYEEGEWTPLPKGTTGSAGSHAHNMHGKYTKIGNVVNFSFYGYLTNLGDWTGYAIIDGLPFTSGVQATSVALTYYCSSAVDAAWRTAHVPKPSTQVRFFGGTAMDIWESYSSWNTGQYLTGSGFYYTTA